MTVFAGLEHVYERVQLVRGKGQRWTGRLCIMSFVALLAGERHTDAPVTASPFIRHFAIGLNDAMPEQERQRLKLFAPRIVGTNDGLDAERARLAQRAFLEEIVPRLRDDLADNWLPRRLGSDWAAYAAEPARSPQEFLFQFVAGAGRGTDARAHNATAIIAAKLLALYATSAASADSGVWYWAKGIDLLDRFCDVGTARPGWRIGASEIARADYVLGHTRPFEALSLAIRDALRDIHLRLSKPESAPEVGLHPDAQRFHGTQAACGSPLFEPPSIPGATEGRRASIVT